MTYDLLATVLYVNTFSCGCCHPMALQVKQVAARELVTLNVVNVCWVIT